MIPPRLILWIAQGFGSGRAPVAPGTFGSLVGLAWFALLAWPGNTTLLVLATAVGCLAAVPLCARAEQILRRKDPGSVVLDEIVAVPLCYLGVWGVEILRLGHGPALGAFVDGSGGLWTAAGFVTFRLLDALKPGFIGSCQSLPGGWGVVADDVAAGLVTGAGLGLARWLLG